MGRAIPYRGYIIAPGAGGVNDFLIRTFRNAGGADWHGDCMGDCRTAGLARTLHGALAGRRLDANDSQLRRGENWVGDVPDYTTSTPAHQHTGSATGNGTHWRMRRICDWTPGEGGKNLWRGRAEMLFLGLTLV